MEINSKQEKQSKLLKNSKRTQTIVGMGMLTALVVVLQLFASSIKLGPFSITLTLVPIIIGAALYGWKAGAWLGFVFGAVVMFTPDVAAFMAINVPATFVTVLLKGTLSGLCAGLIYTLIEKKNRNVAVIVSGIVAPIVNTGVFLIGCFMFFMEIINGLAAASNMAENILLFVVTGMVGWNFLVELAINLVLSSAIVYIIGLVKKRIKIA